MVNHEAKLNFIHKMAKLGLQHFDSGGTVLSGPSDAGTNTEAPDPNSNGILGAIGGFLGLNNQYKAKSAQLQAGTNAGQLNNSYEGVQGALDRQRSLAGTLSGQAGEGAGTQSNLTRMLTEQAQGGGPNPAATQLASATGANVANQAALMAGQRGASANPALIARQAAQQGAGIQQQSAGQAATLTAQQQLAAQQQLQALAGTQVGQGLGATGTLNQAEQGEQSILQNANTAANNARVAMQSNINNVNSGVAGSNQAMAGNILGGITSGISSAATALLAEGGIVRRMADGGVAKPGPASFVGNFLSGLNVSTDGPETAPSSSAAAGMTRSGAQLGSAIGKGLSAGINLLKPAPSATPGTDAGYGSKTMAINPKAAVGDYAALAKGGQIVQRALAAKGGKVKPGAADEKAVKQDDSLKNDKIPALLSEDEIVLPRHITTHPKAPEKAAAFVRAVLAKKKMGLDRRAAA